MVREGDHPGTVADDLPAGHRGIDDHNETSEVADSADRSSPMSSPWLWAGVLTAVLVAATALLTGPAPGPGGGPPPIVGLLLLILIPVYMLVAWYVIRWLSGRRDDLGGAIVTDCPVCGSALSAKGCPRCGG
jgi:hypothetical protein